MEFPEDRVVLTQSLPVIRYPGGIINRLQDEMDVTDVNSLKTPHNERSPPKVQHPWGLWPTGSRRVRLVSVGMAFQDETTNILH